MGQKFQSQDSSVESSRTNTEADWSMGFFRLGSAMFVMNI